MARRWLTRSIRPPDEPTSPNENDPASVPPATVGPGAATPGDPRGVVVAEGAAYVPPPPVMRPAPWSGWPSEWWTPGWNGHVSRLTDSAWSCIDLNSSVFASMPPFLVNAAESLDDEWLTNPDPDVYDMGWPEFARQLWWDFQAVGEAFVLATARYATGWPARFHVVPPWFVNVEKDDGTRSYSIGSSDVSGDICHLRYQSTVDDAHGHGPLEAGAARLVAAEILGRYSYGLASSGGIPPSILVVESDDYSAEQADLLKQQWLTARQNGLGLPAVLTGPIRWEPTQVNPQEMALTDLLTFNESRIAIMLRVPPFLMGLPTETGSLTYQNAQMIADFHWRAGLRPLVELVMAGLSGFLLPRGTTVEVNKDAYVQPDPKTRAETAAIYHGIQDPTSGESVLSVEEIREAEKIRNPEGGPIVG